MEGDLDLFLKAFGFDLQTFATLSLLTFFVVELLKGKFKQVQQWITDVLAILVAAGLTFKVLGPPPVWNFDVVFDRSILVLLVWLVPAGLHKRLKGGG